MPSENKIFIVKCAVYIHGVYGPYDNRADAMDAFRAAYEAESPGWNFDGYHDYVMYEGLPELVGENIDLTEKTRGERIAYKEKPRTLKKV